MSGGRFGIFFLFLRKKGFLFRQRGSTNAMMAIIIFAFRFYLCILLLIYPHVVCTFYFQCRRLDAPVMVVVIVGVPHPCHTSSMRVPFEFCVYPRRRYSVFMSEFKAQRGMWGTSKSERSVKPSPSPHEEPGANPAMLPVVASNHETGPLPVCKIFFIFLF